MSYKIEVIADNSGEWVGNGIRLASEMEALDYGDYKKATWTFVRQVRVVTSDEPVNYRWTGYDLEAVYCHD